MKKLILLIVIVIAIAEFGCRKTDNYVLDGQLWGNPRHNSAEKIKGKVQEMRIQSFMAKEENGKVVRGDRISNSFGNIQKFNSSGTLLSAAYLDGKGGISPNAWSIETEAEGKIINKAMYYLQDTLRGYTKNTYTGGYLKEVKFLNPDNDTLMASIVYNYDQNGNRIKWQMLSYKNDPLQYVDYSFSPEGFLEQRKIYSAPGKMTDLFVFKNNDKGERISEHHENFVNENIIDEVIKYEYDKKGNWVLRVHYRDNKPYRLFEREIKYYD